MGFRKYSYDNLVIHTSYIRSKAKSIVEEQRVLLDEAFSDFSGALAELEQQPKSIERNVKMMLACKMFNHVYSGIILAESGLLADALLCERSALETIAFHWLICVEPSSALEYESGKTLRPVEVRRRLESHGVDIENIRDLYSIGSEFAHVGRSGERLNCSLKSPTEGSLLFGGTSSPNDQSELLNYLPRLLYLFSQPLMK